MMPLVHTAAFVSGLSDLAQAIQNLDPAQLVWSARMFDRVVDLIRRELPGQDGFVGVSIDPFDFEDDDSWCYCIRHTSVVGMNEFVLHHDVNVDKHGVDSGIQINVWIKEPDPEHPEELIERGVFRLNTRKRRFYLYWYGKIFDEETELHESEDKLLGEVLSLTRMDFWSFHGEVSVTQRNAFRMIRTFIQFMKAGSTS